MAPDFTQEEIETLIDMLGEPDRRWYVAGWIAELDRGKKLSESQRTRALEILEVQWHDARYLELVSLKMELRRFDYKQPPRDPRPIIHLADGTLHMPGEEPEPLWACRGYLFDSLEAAEGYKSFSDWIGQKHREQEQRQKKGGKDGPKDKTGRAASRKRSRRASRSTD